MDADEKQILRHRLRAVVRSLGEEKRLEASAAIRTALDAMPAFASARVLCAFAPAACEPDWLAGRWPAASLFFPRVREAALEWAEADGPTALRTGAFGIREPIRPATALRQADVVLVPGMGFDRDGFRLGRGAGFYDRALPLLDAVRVGIAFGCQLVDSVPRASHDQAVDWVVTEDGVWPCGRANRPRQADPPPEGCPAP